MTGKRATTWAGLPLTIKFILIAVPLTVAITVSTFAFLLTTQNQQARIELEERINKLAEIEASSLSGPVWNFNQRQTELILSAAINDPDLIRIRVTDDNDTIIAEIIEDDTDETAVVVTEDIMFARNIDEQPVMIGTLNLTYSQARLEEAMRTNRESAVLLTTLLTCAVVLSALVALHLTVRVPMRRFENAIDTAQRESRFVPVDLKSQDEIGQVAQAYNALQAKQEADEAELRKIKESLEVLVDERTQELAGRESQLSETVQTLQSREAELIAARDTAEESLINLRRTRDRLVQAEKMASLGQLTAGIAHEIKNPLNFVNNFSSLSVEMLEELKETTTAAKDRLTPDEVAEVDELVGTISSNLTKIGEHGKRADTIVRNMLLHSRSGPTTTSETQINAVVDEALNLSFHSARAEIEDFNVEMAKDLDGTLEPIQCYPQDLSRVFINIISNGMYATHKKRLHGGDTGFAPKVTVATKDLGEFVEIAITDNGGGIAKNDVENIFTPFFTTKPAGEGTGLGLSISYDIVVSQHGGDIDVESTVGDGTTFYIRVPKVISQIEESA